MINNINRIINNIKQNAELSLYECEGNELHITSDDGVNELCLIEDGNNNIVCFILCKEDALKLRNYLNNKYNLD